MKFIYLTLLIALSSFTQAETKTENKKGVEALSPQLRQLLSEEMQALQTGMMSIIPAYVSGDWAQIAATAKKMKNSYIMKQQLSKNQAHELHSTLPAAFIEQDQHFHYLAGMLQHVAENKKPELIHFYFSEMNKACMACHKKFAQHRFTAFSTTKQTKEDHHGH